MVFFINIIYYVNHGNTVELFILIIQYRCMYVYICKYIYNIIDLLTFFFFFYL